MVDVTPQALRQGSGMLPTFLGIGAPKAGTTWLYQVLQGHRDVLMSHHRKEVHYFDLNFDRGEGWYRGFFPAVDPLPAAVGEFTTSYLYHPDAPHRVRTVPTIDRFVVILRDPVDRAFSHYRFRLRQDHRSETFDEFLQREPNGLTWGKYARPLRRWVDEHGPERFLVLDFEHAVADKDATRQDLARHLGIDPTRFPPQGDEPANEGFTPRRGRLYGAAVRQARWMRRHDLDRVISLAKRAGVVRTLKAPAPGSGPAGPTDEARRRLWHHFEDDVAELETLSGLDLQHWRPGGRRAEPATDAAVRHRPMTVEHQED